MDPQPAPAWIARWMEGALLATAALAVVSALLARPLRAVRLYEEGTEVATTTLGLAEREAARTALLEETWEQEQSTAAPFLSRLLARDDERKVSELLVQLAEGVDLDVHDLRLGTRRAGDPLDFVPLYAELRGDATSLPPFFADFYAQRRLLRLVAMDVERVDDGIALRMQWEYGALPSQDPPPPSPKERFSAPVVLALLPEDALPSWFDGPREEAERVRSELIALEPGLVEVAALGAKIDRLRARRIWLEAWERSCAAEGRAILRRLPELQQRAAAHPERRAGLRPAAGGNLEIVEG